VDAGRAPKLILATHLPNQLTNLFRHRWAPNVLRRHNLAPAPERSRTTTWKEFIRSHIEVLAETDFFTVEVLTWRGLVTYYVLFFIDVGNHRVSLGGITRHPNSSWMEQVARNARLQDTGSVNGCGYLLHDRDKKFCREFQETLATGGVKCTPIPARSPDLNAHAERWVRSIKEECLSKLILIGENSLRRVVSDFVEHYHQERNYQGDRKRISPERAIRTSRPPSGSASKPRKRSSKPRRPMNGICRATLKKPRTCWMK
jgi:hypothetical protein